MLVTFSTALLLTSNRRSALSSVSHVGILHSPKMCFVTLCVCGHIQHRVVADASRHSALSSGGNEGSCVCTGSENGGQRAWVQPV